MKIKASIKPRCENCKIIRRKGVLRIICSKNPRHKQKSLVSIYRKTRLLNTV